MKGLEFREITRRFDTRTAVEGVSLVIQPGEFFSLLGPSGSGKSTLLRIAAGLERPDGGSVWLDDRNITSLPPQERGIGLVFQNYALFPHMTVGENVSFGLRLRGIPREEMRSRMREALARVDLSDREPAHVTTLSGGEQQRVAVARALVIEPQVLLFDEPLSNLDVTLRQRTRAEIRDLQKRTGITTLYVTHDQAEALSISDRIAVIRDGRIEQVGTPQELYSKPATTFVARFLGWENVFEALVDDDRRSVRLTDLPLALPGGFPDIPPGLALVLLPAEMVHIGPPEHAGTMAGTIERIDFRGETHSLRFVPGALLCNVR